MAFLLIADPSPVVGRFIRVAASAEGHQVIRAARGSVALEIVSQAKPDLVITETDLDDMNVRSFYRRLREAGYSNPVLVLSADDARGVASELGAEAALQKPFDVDEFLEVLRRLLGDR
jgi:DNA-binding response OmpR family regulator